LTHTIAELTLGGIPLPNPLPRIIAARSLGAFSVWLRFDDNAEGVVDLRDAVERSTATSLQDDRLFAQSRVDFGTLVWPGGIDWSPESLHSLLIASNGYSSNRSMTHPTATTRTYAPCLRSAALSESSFECWATNTTRRFSTRSMATMKWR
jgi:hypothetical protein